jgi:hypothetical protein
MSKNPEGRFYEAVEKRLRPYGIHCEGMANPYRGGTPDRYYEGDRKAIWVEYKWYDKLPVRGFDLTAGKSPKLTPLQDAWLERAHDNGVKVYVIVGFPGEKRNQKMGLMLGTKTWQNRVEPEDYELFQLPVDDIAYYLAKQLMQPGAVDAESPSDKKRKAARNRS